MTDRREELLHARVDGELASDLRLELERLLAEDETTRLRAGELEALAETLNLLGPVDPPARVMRAVFDHVAHNAPGALHESHVAATGGSIRTKVLWGLAAAAGIVLAVLAYTGFPPELGGSEGAIGAARRYQAGQIAASDVKLGDQAAQEFLHSDLFDKLMKDESVRKAISDPALAKALTDADFGKALTDPAIGKAMADPALWKALTDADFGKALQDQDFAKALSNPSLGRALVDDAFAKALKDPSLSKALADPALGKALRDPALGRALADPALAKALTDPALVKALADPALGRSLADASLAKALTSADFQTALKTGLAVALKSPQFGDAMRAARNDR